MAHCEIQEPSSIEKNTCTLKYSMEMRTLTLTTWRLHHDKISGSVKMGYPQYFAGVTRASVACYQGHWAIQLSPYIQKSVSVAAPLWEHLEPVLYEHRSRKTDDTEQRIQEVWENRRLRSTENSSNMNYRVGTCVHSPYFCYNLHIINSHVTRKMH
jgi:hypothetical protein